MSSKPGEGQTEDVVFNIGQKGYTVNDKHIETDVAPYLQDGRTMVPIAFAAPALGSKPAIWHSQEKKVEIEKNGIKTILWIGRDYMEVAGKRIAIDVPATIKNVPGGGRTMLPIAWVARALDINYDWDNTVKKATFYGDTIYAQAGTYAPAIVKGNAIITQADTTLQNTIINGNLTIAQSVGKGDITLKNVVVKGETYIRGGGKDSIHIIGGSYNGNIVIEETADGGTRVSVTDAEGVAVVIATGGAGEQVILEGTFENVEVNATNVNLTTQGDTTINNLTVNAADTKVEIGEETKVTTMTANAPTEITGEGSIGTANINADGVTLENEPEEMNVADDVEPPTVEPPAPSTPPYTGGGGGGDSAPPATPQVGAITIEAVGGGIVDPNVPRHERPFPYDAEIKVNLETETEGAEIHCTLHGLKPAELVKNTMDFGKVTEAGIVLRPADVFEQIFGEENAKYGGQAVLKVRATKEGHIDRTEEIVFVFQAESTPVTTLNKNYYVAEEELEFTISNLRPNKKVEIGMPIYLGPRPWPWACDELVLASHVGLTITEEERDGQTVRFWIGTADGDGKITIKGTIGQELSTGKLCITLPNSGHTIDNAISLKHKEQEHEHVNVHVGDSISVRGEPVVEQELTAIHLAPVGAEIVYEWQRADGKEGEYQLISGETGKDKGIYTVTNADVDKWIRVKMTSAPDNDWDILHRWGTSYSNPVGPVTAEGTGATQKYTVVYDGNGNTGGGVPIDSNEYEEGAEVTVLGNTSDLEKVEFTFAGWNTQADGQGTTYTAGDTLDMGTENVVLYAVWKKEEITGSILHAAAGPNSTGVLYTNNGKLYYNEIDDAGNWGAGAEISEGGTEARLAMDSSGNPHVVYSEANSIIYKNGDFTNEVNVAAGKSPDIVLSTGDVAHITYSTINSEPDIIYADNGIGSYVTSIIFTGEYYKEGSRLKSSPLSGVNSFLGYITLSNPLVFV